MEKSEPIKSVQKTVKFTMEQYLYLRMVINTYVTAKAVQDTKRMMAADLLMDQYCTANKIDYKAAIELRDMIVDEFAWAHE